MNLALTERLSSLTHLLVCSPFSAIKRKEYARKSGIALSHASVAFARKSANFRARPVVTLRGRTVVYFDVGARACQTGARKSKAEVLSAGNGQKLDSPVVSFLSGRKPIPSTESEAIKGKSNVCPTRIEEEKRRLTVT